MLTWHILPSSMEIIKSERVYMIMNMVQSRKVKYAKSTYKEKIISAITPYWFIGYIQRIKEAWWERNKKFKNYSLDGLFDRMYFLMTKCGILRGKSLVGENYQVLGILLKYTKIPIHYIVWSWKYCSGG